MTDTEHLTAHDWECTCTTCLLALEVDQQRTTTHRVSDRMAEAFKRALTYEGNERRK